MKKLLIACMIVGTMAFTLTGCGGNDSRKVYSSTAAVPNDVIKEFHEMYPTAEDVKWNIKDGLYEADFEVGNKNMKATYTSDGDVVM